MADEKIVTHTKSGKPVVHGRASSYRHHRCRCRPCMEANAAMMRKSRARAIERGVIPENAHGKAGTYGYYGCRCEPCVTAWRADWNRQEAARRERRRG